jgi:hypothetical protein
VEPTVSGWVPADDPAYFSDAPHQAVSWSEEEDRLIARLVQTTPEGVARQWQRLCALYLPHRSARDVRIRWDTYLKPQQAVRDPRVQQLRAMRRHLPHGSLCVLDGRWVSVPYGHATPEPYERHLDIQSQPVINDYQSEMSQSHGHNNSNSNGNSNNNNSGSSHASFNRSTTINGTASSASTLLSESPLGSPQHRRQLAEQARDQWNMHVQRWNATVIDVVRRFYE